MASGSLDTTVLVGDLTGRIKEGHFRPVQLTRKELLANWANLAWADKTAANRAPEILFWHADPGLKEVEPRTRQTATEIARDPDAAPLTVRWEVRAEHPLVGKKEPTVIPNLTVEAAEGWIVFKAPEKEGAYRLFLYVSDGKGNAATANAPFLVKAAPRAPGAASRPR